MANGQLNLGKQSGGVLSISFPDSVNNTEVVLPESGNLVSVDTAVTNNVIARYDGTTGKLQNSNAMIDDNGSLLLTSGTGALGYGAGAGGTVTQLTSKSTAVTLNKPTGRVITHNAALAAGASVFFILNNNLISAGDTLYPIISGNGNYEVEVIMGTATTTSIKLKNTSASSQSEAVNIEFKLIKGANS